MSAKQLKYEIVFGDSPYELETKVMEWMAKGWVATGGVSIDEDGDYMQAMVLEG